MIGRYGQSQIRLHECSDACGFQSATRGHHSKTNANRRHNDTGCPGVLRFVKYLTPDEARKIRTTQMLATKMAKAREASTA